MEEEAPPQYMRIAMDVASKIVAGDLEEKQKISGRSVLASEYAVSPETVRKAIRLLSDMKVVEVKEKSGIFILSKDNARRYLEGIQVRWDEQRAYNRFRTLFEQYRELGEQVREAGRQMLRTRPELSTWRLPNYVVRMSGASDKIGRNIGSLHFWQATGATIVAIRRAGNIILSPGPDAELYGGDAVIFVGPQESVERVEHFLNMETCVNDNRT